MIYALSKMSLERAVISDGISDRLVLIRRENFMSAKIKCLIVINNIKPEKYLHAKNKLTSFDIIPEDAHLAIISPKLPNQFLQLPSMLFSYKCQIAKSKEKLASIASQLGIPSDHVWMKEGKLKREARKLARDIGVDKLFILNEYGNFDEIHLKNNHFRSKSTLSDFLSQWIPTT